MPWHHQYPHNTAGQWNSSHVESTGRESSHMGVSTTYGGKVWLSVLQMYQMTKSMTWEWPDTSPVVDMMERDESESERHKAIMEILQDQIKYKLGLVWPKIWLTTIKVCWRPLATAGASCGYNFRLTSYGQQWVVRWCHHSDVIIDAQRKITGNSCTSQDAMALSGALVSLSVWQ